MKFACCLTSLFLAALIPPAAIAAESAPREVWEIQFDNGGIVDLRLLREGEKMTAGFALETDRNVPWFADASGLSASADGRLTGKLILTPGPDLVAVITASQGKSPPSSPKPEELTVELSAKEGRIRGTIAGRKMTGGLLGHGVEVVQVRGRSTAEAPAANAQIEFMPLGVASTGSALTYAVGEAAYLRLQLRDGKVQAAKLIPVYQKAAPVDLGVRADQVLVTGNKVKGRVPFKFQTVGSKPQEYDGTISLDGMILGDLVAGTATWEGAGQPAAETRFRGRVSRAKFPTPWDSGSRTWEPQGKPLAADPELAARAREEAGRPLLPGEPGKQDFYSTRPIHLKKFFAQYAPTIGFAEAPNAVRYRITIAAAKNGGPAGGPWSFEAEKPWVPLSPVWQEIPPGQLVVTAVGLDRDGKGVGPAKLPETTYGYRGGDPLDEKGFEHWTHPNRARQVLKQGRVFPALAEVPITKRGSFAGPYWIPDRTPTAAALALGRFVRDDMSRALYRGSWSMAGFTGGDGGDAVGVATMARACALVARLTDDPVERDEAITLAERLAWRVYLSHAGKLPTVYKHNACLMTWIGAAYLDVYGLRKDDRFQEAALSLARALATDQYADGGWPGAKTPWPGGVFGPSEFRTNGAEAVLWYLGRVRKELATSDFADNERRALVWVKSYCLPAMTWQNVGYHSAEMVPVQDTVAPHALAFSIWMLDSAEKTSRDVRLVSDIARWCEERHVDWTRTDDPTATRPTCWGWTRAAGTGVRTAGSLAYVCARLWRETGDPLWKAKAAALVQGILVCQDPEHGGLAYHFQRSTEDAMQTHHTYDTVEAAQCLVAVSELLSDAAP